VISSRNDKVGFGTQVRRSPFYNSTRKWGATGYSVYNHMYIPRSFGDPQQNFWNLVNDAILCDVGVERQVEVTGPDAARFVQYLTPRNLSQCETGQCKYVLITTAEGGIINDPVLLRLGQNHFWLSLADSDVLLWARGVQVHSGLDVNIVEPDVSPLQLQGPKSRDIMRTVFGGWIDDLAYYRFVEYEHDGIPLVISRTGWSSELGYEIFLRDGSRGDELWELLMAAGRPMGLAPGHTSTIRRVEGGMLSYHADMTIDNNPFELGLDRLVDLDMQADFIGKQALRRIRDDGARQRQVGVEVAGLPLTEPNEIPWPILADGRQVGRITSAIYSPRLQRNIALALLDVEFAEIGIRASTETTSGPRDIVVVPRPFYDPQKSKTVS
jgi:glycine cleavage system aminomethyltransferase T